MLQKHMCRSIFRGTLTAFQSNRCISLSSNDQYRYKFPEILPDKPSVILFPGQGSQYVGMAKAYVDIPEAKELFDIASEVLR